MRHNAARDRLSQLNNACDILSHSQRSDQMILLKGFEGVLRVLLARTARNYPIYMSTHFLNLLNRTWLYCTVFITGAAVMVIELLGTRLIAPFYGASLYVWTSVISVTLIALACGYFVGGRWADRSIRFGLATIIALSGFLTLVVPWLTAPVLLMTDPLELRMGTFASTLILFTPSLFMLGMVGPFAVKLVTSNLDDVGTSTGSIYAASTVGSVIGTLFLGFYLFPQVGSREIFIGLGLGLLALAFCVAYFERNRVKLAVSLSTVTALFTASVILLPFIADSGKQNTDDQHFQTRFERESLYGWVRVVDNSAENYRLLMMDASAIGAASISHGENILMYQEIVTHLPKLAPGMQRALLIGQGAGHMAMTLKQYGIETDTLEIDPVVSEAARTYFDFQPTGKTIIGDARYEVRKLKGPYDLVIMDVFTGGSEPVHLLTTESMFQLQSLLSDNGVVALNFVAFYEDGRNAALASVAKTLAHVFPHQIALISEPGREFNDFVFIASNQFIDIDAAHLNSLQRNWFKQRLVTPDQTQGFVLTDNLNPLESLQARKAEHYRLMMADFFGLNQFIR
ncbi:Spermidine synthase [Nitrosomonas sp. Nm51]|uniref:fused MFS/spermidine synthase n=1 Tax=Nitrosomonas sp. Nm51 TaxID=133720 RepID=UPI0008B68D45|nr:fused MFS/spermidine synthase [Nitrosomonas sp. Nm51]SER70948.1 Spermidine synthase [Nitrosomonas sp. Nm51]